MIVRTSLWALLLGMLVWPLAAQEREVCPIAYSILLNHPSEPNGREIEGDSSGDIVRSRIVKAIQESLRSALVNYFALPLIEQSNQEQRQYLTVSPIISLLRISELHDLSEEATTDQKTERQEIPNLRTIDLTVILELDAPTDGIADGRYEIALSLKDTPDEELPQRIHNLLSEKIKSLLVTAAGEITRGRILYVDKDLVFVSLGSSDGLHIGDELLSLTPTHCPTTEHEGIRLYKIIETDTESATAQLIIGEQNQIINEPLMLDRRYVALEPYASSLIDLSFQSAMLTAGLRFYPIDGFFIIRPFAALELAIPVGRFTTLFPLHLYGGVELNWYIGPLLFSPRIGSGVALGLGLSNGQSFLFTHIGAIGSLTTSIWLARDIALSIDLGYGYWFGIYNSSTEITDETTAAMLQGYGGILAGIGLRFKL